jgi:hypothetical protein
VLLLIRAFFFFFFFFLLRVCFKNTQFFYFSMFQVDNFSFFFQISSNFLYFFVIFCDFYYNYIYKTPRAKISAGLVGQAFQAAIREELGTHLRMVAHVQSGCVFFFKYYFFLLLLLFWDFFWIFDDFRCGD